MKDFRITDIPADIGKEFKAACAHYGISMRGTLINYMENIINDYRKYQKGLSGVDKKTKKGGSR